jgi:nucleotide-binding universal stress UspA family protein
LERAGKYGEQVKQTNGSKVKFNVRELDGSASRKVAIVQACYNLDADLLILGAKGATAELHEAAGGAVKADVSSIPHYAMHNAPCPVLVVKQ